MLGGEGGDGLGGGNGGGGVGGGGEGGGGEGGGFGGESALACSGQLPPCCAPGKPLGIQYVMP